MYLSIGLRRHYEYNYSCFVHELNVTKTVNLHFLSLWNWITKNFDKLSIGLYNENGLCLQPILQDYAENVYRVIYE